MKPHPRIRKTVKWGGAVVCVVLVVAWVGSWWWQAYFTGDGWGGHCMSGFVRVYFVPQGKPSFVWPEITAGREIGRATIWVFRWQTISGVQFVTLPLWIALLPTLLITTAAWRLDILAQRRMLAGLCPKCLYDRSGLSAAAVCPECGAAAPVHITNP